MSQNINVPKRIREDSDEEQTGCIELSAEYLAVGANRHPSAADWDASGILAFGTDRNIALWRPQVRPCPVVRRSLKISDWGHKIRCRTDDNISASFHLC